MTISRWRNPLVAVIALVVTVMIWQRVEDMLAAHCWICWYQSIPMPALLVIMAVASIRRDTAGGRRYGVPIAAAGLLLTLWHALIEWGTLSNAADCGTASGCQLTGTTVAGLSGLTFAALVAYAAALVILLLPSSASGAADPLDVPMVDAPSADAGTDTVTR